jgi:hypothetical protein
LADDNPQRVALDGVLAYNRGGIREITDDVKRLRSFLGVVPDPHPFHLRGPDLDVIRPVKGLDSRDPDPHARRVFEQRYPNRLQGQLTVAADRNHGPVTDTGRSNEQNPGCGARDLF